MGIEADDRHDDDGREQSEDGGSCDDDNEFDYGFAGDDDDDDDEDAYEVDYTSMNVSPEILRMLGASEEVIAAKEAEISHISSTWVPPTETGLEHSDAIADAATVALVSGRSPSGAGVCRVYSTVGGYEGTGAATTTPEVAPVLKVKARFCPEPVPKEEGSRLPSGDGDNSSDGNGDGDESEDSWDEASAIDGHTWWESGLNDEEYVMSAAMSHNLRVALGLANLEEGVRRDGDWRPPLFAGLNNSEPITTLMPVVVGQRHGLEVEYKAKMLEEGVDAAEDGDRDEDWLEEEGWDYEDVPDDEYIFDWSTNISPNLANVVGHGGSVEETAKAISEELTWKPPACSGLKNSSPIIVGASRLSAIK